MSLPIRLISPCDTHLGEGAFWDHATQTLWWLDVPMPSRLFSWHPASGRQTSYAMPEMITSMRAMKNSGCLIIASHGGINRFDPTTGSLTRLFDPEPGKPFNRCNDGGTDGRGRFWFGTMQNNIAPNGDGMAIVSAAGSLFCLDPDFTVPDFTVPDFTVHERASGIGIANTVCWSPDQRTFYFSDTMTGVIAAYDFDLASGTINNQRDFARFERGVPDGSAMDAEGFLWNARWGGQCVVRFAPDGRVDRVIDLPVSLPTSLAFGGEDLATLYITTARHGFSPEQRALEPWAGHLLACEPGVVGLAVPAFG